MTNRIAADDIRRLLLAKHSKDIAVPECKTGPTLYGNHCKLDFWACKKSWKNCIATGYEIKVYRSDFLQDTKWHKYLSYCHEFYFVSPPDIVMAAELPDGVGLIWTSKNGKRLYTKRKAARRDITVPADLLFYILMWRASIADESSEESGIQYWQRWLEQKQEKRELGCRVGNALRELYKKDVLEARQENRKLKAEIKNLQPLLALCKRLDIDPSSWSSEQRLEEKLIGAMPRDFTYALNGAIERLTAFRDELNKVTPKEGEGE